MTTLSELPLKAREHLAWRLDNKTGCGMLTACRIARLESEMNNWPIYRIFEWAGKSTHSAKIHAAKVIKFAVCGVKAALKNVVPYKDA